VSDFRGDAVEKGGVDLWVGGEGEEGVGNGCFGHVGDELEIGFGLVFI
jgi:hypothetical protein